MDFDESPEEAAFRAEARGWLEAAAGSDAARRVRAGNARVEDWVARAKPWQAYLADHGWAGITWPKDSGGRGGTANVIGERALGLPAEPRVDKGFPFAEL